MVQRSSSWIGQPLTSALTSRLEWLRSHRTLTCFFADLEQSYGQRVFRRVLELFYHFPRTGAVLSSSRYQEYRSAKPIWRMSTGAAN